MALLTRDNWLLPRSLAFLALVGMLAAIQFDMLPNGGWQTGFSMVGITIISAINLWLMWHSLGAGNPGTRHG